MFTTFTADCYSRFPAAAPEQREGGWEAPRSHGRFAFESRSALRSTGHRLVATASTTLALLLLGRLLFDVFDDVADGLKFFGVFVRHFDPKFFFKSHHQFDDIQ